MCGVDQTSPTILYPLNPLCVSVCVFAGGIRSRAAPFLKTGTVLGPRGLAVAANGKVDKERLRPRPTAVRTAV